MVRETEDIKEKGMPHTTQISISKVTVKQRRWGR